MLCWTGDGREGKTGSSGKGEKSAYKHIKLRIPLGRDARPSQALRVV